jgi:hypothetical protein
MLTWLDQTKDSDTTTWDANQSMHSPKKSGILESTHFLAFYNLHLQGTSVAKRNTNISETTRGHCTI